MAPETNPVKLEALKDVFSPYWFTAFNLITAFVVKANVSPALTKSILLTVSSSALKVAVAFATVAASTPERVTV
ncbi:hypothetical protein D3C85_1612940 [compost metagenome]